MTEKHIFNLEKRNTPENAYPKALAEVYDLITLKYYDYPAAVAELAKIINGRGPLLEIGIGTGNVAIPLAQKGYEICGIDYSKPMIDLLAQKLKNPESPHLHITTQAASTESFWFSKQFEAIYAYGGDPYFIQTEDQLWYEGDDAEDEIFWKRLKNIHTHLKPGGLLVFNIQPEHSISNTYLELDGGIIFTTSTHFASDNRLEKTYNVKSTQGETSFTVKKKRISLELALENAKKIGFGNFKTYNQFVSLENIATLQSLQNQVNELNLKRKELIEIRESIYRTIDRSPEIIEKLSQVNAEIETISEQIDGIKISLKRF